MSLTIFYDDRCPLCSAEMRQLKAQDINEQIHLVGLHETDFSERYPHIDREQADRILHGMLDTHEMLYGLDVTCTAWSLVGKHRWLALLRWPLIRPLADIIYLGFARYRPQISYLLTGRSSCENNRCTIDKQSFTS